MTIELVLLSGASYRGREIVGPRLRGLLALLADDLRAGCSSARLIDGLWGEELPEHPAKALQVLVSRVRAALGSSIIASTPVGYRLALGEEQVDASAVLLSATVTARCARDGDHGAALAQAEAGLALWGGGSGGGGSGVSGGGCLADADIGSADPLAALRAARVPTYRALVRARALALARLGRCGEAVEPLSELIRERPRDEEVLAELLRCEAATSGPSTALARYDAYRQALRSELGSDPGSALRRLHLDLLQGDTPVVRHGVLHEPNPLLGRDDDIAAVAKLLHTARVTSIVGPGGLGKTRLAHVVSRQADQRVVQFVALAGVRADGDVAGEVASVLGVTEAGPGAGGRGALSGDVAGGVVAGIAGALGPGPALLVLDNCEHVVRGAAELVHALVSQSKDLRVLTTSRAPLGLSSESVYPLPELNLPTMVELFHQRAQAARPGVELPAEAVRELCGHLDGLPLAVDRAAARVRVMSVAEIARRLDDRFTLLRGTARDAPQRHQTLAAVIDWSWRLLEPDDQAAMRALLIFPGGFTAGAAQQLLGGDALPVVERLVDQSLLKVADTGLGTRLRMLETVREFSTAERERAGEGDETIERFLAWARGFGVVHMESSFGPDSVDCLRRIRAEQDNLVQALRYGLDRADGATVAATGAVLAGLWSVGSNFTRMGALADETARLLSHYRPAPEFVEATRAVAVLATLSSYLVQGSHAARFLVALRRLPPAPPDTMIRATEIVLGARTGARVGTPAGGSQAPTLGAPTLDELCDSEAPLLAAMANVVVGFVREGVGDLDGALVAARRTLAVMGDHGGAWLRAGAQSRIGELCLQLDRGAEGRDHLVATMPVLEELEGLGARSGAARVRWAIVLAHLQCGDVDEAERWFELTMQRGGAEEADLPLIDLVVRAEILLARGEVEAGLRLWRRVADPLRNPGIPAHGRESAAVQPGALDVQAVTVVAHAQHGRLDLVADLADQLPDLLARVIADRGLGAVGPSVSMSLRGALLLALALVDLDRAERTGDPHATSSAVRMIALAQRFRFQNGFHPTMAAVRARQTAERADESAYADAVSAYADLGGDALGAAMAAALRARDHLTGQDPA